jgi:hypothetical protein
MNDREYLKRRYAVGHPKVLDALRRWDPIGVSDDSPHEYDTYAPVIVGLLDRGISRQDLARYLSQLVSENMGGGSDPTQDDEIAEELVSFWKTRRQ